MNMAVIEAESDPQAASKVCILAAPPIVLGIDRLGLSISSRRRLSHDGSEQPATIQAAHPEEPQEAGSQVSPETYDHGHLPEMSTEDEELDYLTELQRGPSYRRAGGASRASSVISTGTKMSFRTLAQPETRETQTHHGPIDIVLGRRNFRITPRPGSILSISSFDHGSSIQSPAPPYEADAGVSDGDTLHDEALEDFESTDGLSEVLAQPIPRRPLQGDLITEATLDHADPISRPPSPPSPPSSPASRRVNMISAHYTNVVRTIDSNHQREIAQLKTTHEAALGLVHQEIITLKATHAVELSTTRNNIDAAYRLEFRQVRSKSESQIRIWSAQIQEMETKVEESEHLLTVTLDAIQKERARVAEERETERTRLTSDRAAEVRQQKLDHEAATEQMRLEFERRLEIVRKDLAKEQDEAVRKARNEVEDLWEGRWRDRMKLAKEEIGAAFGEKERVAACWEEEVKRRWPGAEEIVRNAVENRLKRERVEERKRSGSGSSIGGTH